MVAMTDEKHQNMKAIIESALNISHTLKRLKVDLPVSVEAQLIVQRKYLEEYYRVPSDDLELASRSGK